MVNKPLGENTPGKEQKSGAQLPDEARVVVIGGGIIGCSVAYHLAEMGCESVLLLERDQFTSGTTWHAAGLMTTYGSTSETMLGIRRYSRELYERLEAETGQQTGFAPVGFIELAAGADRLEEQRRIAAFNRYHGNEVQELSPGEIQSLFPPADLEGVSAGFFSPGDGRINPVDITMALVKGARMKGATLVQNTPVEAILTHRGAVCGVRTKAGEVRCEVAVNCAGMWARQLGEKNGICIPNQAAEHYYLITGEMDGMTRDLPIIEDPSRYAYYREETGGLMIGLFEKDCAPWRVEGIPEDFSWGELDPDWDRLTPFLENAMARVPAAMDAGIRQFFCGPESFTPDIGPIVGEAPELRNYFIAAGLNSVGIITGGGIGRVVAHWILNGRPDIDVTAINVDRFHPWQCNPAYRRARAYESLGQVYQCHYPDKQWETARHAKRSPFHDRLAEQGAYFRDVSGWESPAWYAPDGCEAKVDQLGWGRQNWFDWWAAEHKTCREGVIAMDMSFMGKFLVQGRDSGAVLNRVSANEVDGRAGRITYTQWLNEDGGIEADLTVIKLSEQRFMVVTSDTAHRHTETWLQRHVDTGQNAVVTDVTSAYGQLNIQGPRSRELLQSVTSADLSNEAFPFRCVKEIDVGYARVICVRITYLGELGYELYIPSEQAVHVYDILSAAGERFGLRHAGLRALSSLRMEKAYRDWGHDIDNTDDPYRTGLGFAVRLDKAGDFIGKAACRAIKDSKPWPERLVQVLVDDPEPMMFHGEIIWRNGTAVGEVRAASYGHTLGGAVGLAYLKADTAITADWLECGDWEVDIAGTRFPCSVSLRPMYDPEMKRVRG